MKRFVIAALAAGLWAGAAQAQREPYASTVPAVPMPVVSNGEVQDPGGRFGPRLGGRVFAATRWAPGGTELPAPTSLPNGIGYGYPVPPPPAGAGGPDGLCGAGRCATPSRGFSWERLKAWWCFHYSPTDIPKCVPTPFTPPLLGMFPCNSASTAGCASPGCGHAPAPYPPGGPQYPPNPMQPPVPPMMTPPTAPPPHTPGMMPVRGSQGAAVPPTWQGRTQPAPATTGIPGYRYATPTPTAARPVNGPVVGAGYTPQK